MIEKEEYVKILEKNLNELYMTEKEAKVSKKEKNTTEVKRDAHKCFTVGCLQD